MKKLALYGFILGSIVLVACSLLERQSALEYNNEVVAQINQISTAIEQSATLYNESLPDVVTETDTLDLTEMQTAYEEAERLYKKIENLLKLESRNLEQENAVRTELETYQSAAELYLTSYSKMLEYYVSGAYQENIAQVEIYDETLHTHYTTFIETNNDLVDTLENFVVAEE